MVKLTRIDKFRKAIRLPSSDDKSDSTIKKHQILLDSTDDLEVELNPLNHTSASKVDSKNSNFGIKVNKNRKKKIILNKIETTNNSVTVLSRGKRKREAKKLAFRKKFDFEKTCLEILKENKSIDKHGQALGSFKNLKSSLDIAEKKLIKVNKLGKKRNKIDFKLRLKKRNFKELQS